MRAGHGQIGVIDCLADPAQGWITKRGVKHAGERHADLSRCLRQYGQPEPALDGVVTKRTHVP